jgi:DNA-binding CsgD family transcriptional regulator
LDSARESGSLLLLPAALTEVSLVLLHRGELDAVGRLLTQLDATTSSMQAPRLFEAALLHDGWSGADELISTARRSALQRGDGAVLATAALSEAVLNNGLGHYNAALTAAHDAMRFDELLTYGRAATELIEAASRTGEHAAGHQALAALTERTQLATTDWALGIEARSRALLSGDAAPEPFYREAVERLSRTRMTADLARARLVYGEWLRRQGRRVDARAELALARETLVSIGATAFADRADREYRAAGETIRQGPLQGRRLTPQESRVTAMARQGLTNPQIGERLYLSPRTVEYHLHKVYEKLGISSRRELVHAFPCQDAGSDVLPDDSQQPASRQ